MIFSDVTCWLNVIHLTATSSPPYVPFRTSLQPPRPTMPSEHSSSPWITSFAGSTRQYAHKRCTLCLKLFRRGSRICPSKICGCEKDTKDDSLCSPRTGNPPTEGPYRLQLSSDSSAPSWISGTQRAGRKTSGNSDLATSCGTGLGYPRLSGLKNGKLVRAS